MADDEGEQKGEKEGGDGEKAKPDGGSTGGDGDKGGGAGDGGSPADIPADVKSYIDSKFDALSELIQGKNGEKHAPLRRTDLQEEARRLVEEASQRLEADKAHAESHAKIEKKETEKPPIKQSRAQRFLFGKIDE